MMVMKYLNERHLSEMGVQMKVEDFQCYSYAQVFSSRFMKSKKYK
jgi:hypothetical protein